MCSPEKKIKSNPIQTANFISKIFVWWMRPIIWAGHKRDLQQDDLYDVLDKDCSSYLGDLLERQWNIELKSSKENGKHPSLLKAIFKTFGRQYILSGFLGFMFAVVTRIVQPLLMAKVIKYFMAGNTMTHQEGLLYGGGMVIVGFISLFFGHHSKMNANYVGMRIRIACCSLMYRKVMRLSKASSGQTTTGHLVNLMSNDVTRFDLALPFLHYIWIGPLQFATVAYILWLSLGVSGLIGICCIVLNTVPVQSGLTRLTASLRRQTAMKTDSRIRLMNEIISGIQVVKMYGWEKPFAKLVSASRKAEISLVKKSSYLRAVCIALRNFNEKSSLFYTVLAYYYFGNFISSDKIFSTIQLYSVLNLTYATFFPLALSTGAETRVSVNRIQEFLMHEERAISLPVIPKLGTMDDKRNTVGVTILNGCAKWEAAKEKNTLDNITLHVKPGTLCAVIGPVGCGKSSLLHVILGELSLLNGTAIVDDTISYASQEPWLFVGSVRENILFGEQYEVTKYEEVVRVCALQKDFELLPNGDSTVMGERGVMLSGGQRARINLARAIYRNADLYLLDDPLSAVDTRVGKHLFDQCIRTYLRGKTCILVTHQLQYLKDADMIVILKDGKIDNQGTYKEMIKSGLDFAKLLPPENKESSEAVGESGGQQVTNKNQAHSTRRPSLSASTTFINGKPQLLQEMQTVGKMRWSTYYGYARAGGSLCLVLFVTFMLFVAESVIGGVDYWVSIWTRMEEDRRIFQYSINSNGTDKYVEYISPEYFFTTTEALQIYGGLIVLCFIVVLLRTLSLFHLCMRSSANLHNAVFENVIHAKMRFFDTNPSGRILNRFSQDMGAIDEQLPAALADVLEVLLVVVGILTMIIIVNYIMVAPTIVTLLLFMGIRKLYISTAISVKRLERINKSPVFSYISSSLNGLTTIRSRRAEKMTCNEFDEYQDKHTSSWYIFVASDTAFCLWLDNISNLFIAAVTFTFLLSPGGTFGAAVGLALSQALTLTGVVQYGVRQSTQLVSQFTSVERVLEYTHLDSESDLESTPEKRPPRTWPEEGGIRFLNLSLKYSEIDPPVLKDLEFTILPKQKVGIVGRTGAGKTSLIAALYRLAELQGTITIDDVDIKTIGLHDLRRRLSIIPQMPVLFTASLRDNLDPFNEFTDDHLYSALELVELKDAVGSLDYRISEGGSNFSVGQRQLVCLARAFLTNNKILILDEATANVDPQTDALIQRTVRQKFKNCTVLTIAHRLNTIMDSDRVLVMDEGVVQEFGHPYILLQNEYGCFYKMVAETGPAVALQLYQVAEQAYFSEQEEIPGSENETVTSL